jgi:non-specific serine/threonine protein kinase
MRMLTADQILAGLKDRFRLLTGGTRTTLPRHRTLRASVDWSYGLLSEEERIILRRIAVFAGGFGLDAVEAVCTDGNVTPERVLDILTALVDRSLVCVEELASPILPVAGRANAARTRGAWTVRIAVAT